MARREVSPYTLVDGLLNSRWDTGGRVAEIGRGNGAGPGTRSDDPSDGSPDGGPDRSTRGGEKT